MPDRGRLLGVDGSVTRSRVAAGATTAAIALGGVMVASGHAVDPWTAGLTGAAALAVATAPWQAMARRRRVPGLFDEDGRTGVGTARAALSLMDRELERARTYGSLFSLTVLEIDRAVFADLAPRRAHRLVATMVAGLAADVRIGDRVCHATASDRELVVVVLPDTGGQGAHTFVGRLLTHAQRHLATEGLAFEGHVRADSYSHPDDLAEMERLQRRLEVLDGAEALIRDVAVRQRRARHTSEPAAHRPTELSGTRAE